MFEVWASWLRQGYGKTCSDACRAKWRLQRGRGRDGQPWEEVATRLRAMGPTALDELKPPTAEIVRRFYGLVDGTPWTQLAIADHLGLTKTRVQQILHSAAVTHLLGKPARRRDRKTVVVACAICGTDVERTPRELRDRAQTTCGPDCQREFRLRLVSRIACDADIRAKRVERHRQKTSSQEFAEHSRQTALRRARPHAETLRALPETVFDALPALERDVLRRYYGLGDSPPQMLNELSRQKHIGEPRLRKLIDQGLARILHHVGDPAALLLPAPVEPTAACSDHPCDGCAICRRGMCCRGDNPARQVRLGDWDGPIYGKLGVLEGDGDRVCCHACGGWYVQLGNHAGWAHGLSAEIYKIIFGLNVSTGLAGDRYRERMRPHAQQHLSPYWSQAAETLAAITPEQREAFDRSKRLEARLDPHNRVAWLEGAHRGGAKIHELYEAGQYQPPLVRDPRLVERHRQRMRQKAADPAYRAALIRQLSKGARDGPELVERTCVACGNSFETRASLVRAGQGKTCSPGCAHARRAQALRDHHPAATAPEAWSQSTRLSARAQWHENPRYQRIAAALRALDSSVLAGVPTRDRQMIRWYYGLDRCEVLDYRQIAARLELKRSQVTSRLHRVLARLLGGDVMHGPGDRNGTTRDRCSVCRVIDR